MRLGLSCTSFTWPGGDSAIREGLAAAARGAAERGLHGFWVMDHLWQIEGLGRPEELMLESYTALAHVAALTHRVTLGTLVTGVPDAAGEAWQDHLGILAERLTKVVPPDDDGADH